jgi:hypothetical protein
MARHSWRQGGGITAKMPPGCSQSGVKQKSGSHGRRFPRFFRLGEFAEYNSAITQQ